MKILGSLFNPSSSSSPSLSPTCSSSSFASSPLNSASSNDRNTRCEGLDLLVKAVQHIAGTVVLDVPLMQKKVVKKGKRAFRYRKTVKSEIEKEQGDEKTAEEKKDMAIEVFSKPIRRKRTLALPSKFQDSVLQPWKRRTRRPQSIQIDGGLAS